MSEQHRPDPDQDDSERQGVPVTVTSDGERVVVVTPDGMGVSEHGDPPADQTRERPTNPADLVEQPAKVMRIGSMVKQLLDEVRSAPLDEPGCCCSDRCPLRASSPGSWWAPGGSARRICSSWARAAICWA